MILASVITIVNYDHRSFIVQATVLKKWTGIGKKSISLILGLICYDFSFVFSEKNVRIRFLKMSFEYQFSKKVNHSEEIMSMCSQYYKTFYDHNKIQCLYRLAQSIIYWQGQLNTLRESHLKLHSGRLLGVTFTSLYFLCNLIGE